VTDLIVILCRGDITRRDEVAWGFTTKDAIPFLEYLKRDLMFREVVIAFFTGGKGTDSVDAETEEFCRLCRKAGLNKDCASCSRKVEVADVR